MAITPATNQQILTRPANFFRWDAPPWAKYAVVQSAGGLCSTDGVIWQDARGPGQIVLKVGQHLDRSHSKRVYTSLDAANAVTFLGADAVPFSAGQGSGAAASGADLTMAELSITSIGVFEMDADVWAVSGNLWAIDKNPAASTAPWTHVSGGTWEIDPAERVRAIVARFELDPGTSATRGVLEGEAQLMALNADADPNSSPSLGEDLTPMQHFEAENNGGGVFGMDRWTLTFDLTLGEEAMLKQILVENGDNGIQPWLSDLQFAAPLPTEVAGAFTLTCELFQVS